MSVPSISLTPTDWVKMNIQDYHKEYFFELLSWYLPRGRGKVGDTWITKDRRIEWLLGYGISEHPLTRAYIQTYLSSPKDPPWVYTWSGGEL